MNMENNDDVSHVADIFHTLPAIPGRIIHVHSGLTYDVNTLCIMYIRRDI